MKVKFEIPDYVQKVARMLLKEGFKCYLVGGALRDIVLNILPDDYDLATDAKPEDMLRIFPKAVSTGAKFGMVSALVQDELGETHEVQVTTFRSEEDYVDGRWPTKVVFIDNLDKDLGRRDFTFNAMALDFSQTELDGKNETKEWEVYDPFEGARDLGLKVVRAVGTPLERFTEDGLRAFRACRLASQLGFDIEEETFNAIRKSLPVVAQVSMERVRDEFVKIVTKSPKPSIGLELLRRSGLLELFLPELLEGNGVEQKLFHSEDVYQHLIHTCDIAPANIRMAALFHDIAKPRKATGDGHFYGHDVEGAKMVKEIMTRMRFSNSEIEHTVTLIRNHMFYFPHLGEGLTQDQIDEINEKAWSDSAVRRFIMRVGEENIDDLFALRVADAASNPKSAFNPAEIEQLQERISEVRQKDMALKVSDLRLNGQDLEELGIPKGPEMGKLLNRLLERVVDNPLLNTKETLTEIVKSDSDQFKEEKVVVVDESKIDDVYQIVRECADWLSVQGLDHWQSYYTKEVIRENFKKGSVVVLYVENDPAGTASYSEAAPYYYTKADLAKFHMTNNKVWYLGTLGVRPKYMQKGYAKTLIKYLEEKASSEGVSSLRFDARADYDKFIKFYQKMGYTIAGEMEEDDQKYYFMEKDL